MTAIKEVYEHVQDIQEARDLIGASEERHPTSFYLALLHVESKGREDLNDRDSYIGPLQVGDSYLDDAEDYAEEHHPELLEMIPEDNEGLRRDAKTSILVAMLHMEKWRHRHEWDVYRMAALHKGGVGTANKIKKKIKGGMTVEQAIMWVSLHFRYSKNHRNVRKRGKLIVPRTFLYVYGHDPHTKVDEYRFEQALKDYTKWLEDNQSELEVVVSKCPTCGQYT